MFSPVKIGVLDKFGSKIGITKTINEIKPAQEGTVSQNVRVTPTPDVSDQALDQDLTALDKDLANIDTTGSDLSNELKGL